MLTVLLAHRNQTSNHNIGKPTDQPCDLSPLPTTRENRFGKLYGVTRVIEDIRHSRAAEFHSAPANQIKGRT